MLFFLLGSCEKDRSVKRVSDKPGEKADEYLDDQPYRGLKFHIHYMKGYEPTGRAIDSVRSFLGRHLKKPGGIDVETYRIESQGKSAYSVGDLEEIIQDKGLYAAQNSERINAYLLIVDGKFGGDDGSASTLGLAFRSRRMALFGDPVHDNSDEPTEPPRWKLEGTVMRHEFGHLLGLVDNGTPMVNEHKDDQHGSHCDNSDCLMYYSTETSDVVANLFGSSMPRLDANCQKDLEGNGGK